MDCEILVEAISRYRTSDMARKFVMGLTGIEALAHSPQSVQPIRIRD